MLPWLTSLQFSLSKSVVVLLAVLVVACLDLVSRVQQQRKAHYVFGVVLGTVLSVGLIAVITHILQTTREQNGYFMAAAILFLASDLAAMVTGHTLPVDGGWTAR